MQSIWCCVFLMSFFSPCMLFAAQGEQSPYLHSTWHTTYEAPSGNVVAIVKIDGDAGTYTLQTGGVQPVGRLTGIQFVKNFNHQALGPQLGTPTNALVGRWQLNTSTGYFVFREPNRQGSMNGYFGSFLRDGQPSQVLGSWDGRLLELRPVPPQLDLAPSEPAKALDIPSNTPEAQTLNALPRTSDEQVTGRTTDIIPISFLRDGIEITPAIGQLRLKNDARPLTGKGDERQIRRRLDPLGTCFLISDSLVMTAYHVFKADPDELLANMEIKFESESSEHIRPIINKVLVLESLDVAVLRTDTSESQSIPHFRLTDALDRNGNARIVPDEGLEMLHFPAQYPGLRLTVHNSFYTRPKFRQPALEGVRINDLLIYTTDTDKGSSGAPLMNSSWRVIAVHLGDVTIDGNEKLNRGVRVDSIVRAIKGTADAELTKEILGVSMGPQTEAK